jgi:hypothetical protein
MPPQEHDAGKRKSGARGNLADPAAIPLAAFDAMKFLPVRSDATGPAIVVVTFG